MKNEFLLNPSVTYLNHGSFGASPKAIFEEYQQWQLKIEAEPFRFFLFDGPRYLKEAREALSNYVNCDSEDIVFMTNPTTAVNVVAKNFPLEEGDEILSTDLEYGACDRTWNYYCKKAGAKYIRQTIQLPIQGKQQILEDFWSGYTENTKAIFISHITSATALILPIPEIVDEAKQRGLVTIIDGAHVPGHIPLDIQALDPDIYVGACHKWMCTPKGSTFLYAKKDYQSSLDPLIVSWGYEAMEPSNSQFLDYHEMQGTRDFSAFLVTPFVIDYLDQNNWWEKSAMAKQLILENYQDLCDILGSDPICPISSDFLGQMCSVPISNEIAKTLNQDLFDQYQIEIPVSQMESRFFLRLSLNAYNTQKDIDYLKNCLRELLG